MLLEQLMQDAAAMPEDQQWQLLVDLLEAADLMQQRLIFDPVQRLNLHQLLNDVADSMTDRANERGYDIA